MNLGAIGRLVDLNLRAGAVHRSGYSGFDAPSMSVDTKKLRRRGGDFFGPHNALGWPLALGRRAPGGRRTWKQVRASVSVQD